MITTQNERVLSARRQGGTPKDYGPCAAAMDPHLRVTVHGSPTDELLPVPCLALYATALNATAAAVPLPVTLEQQTTALPAAARAFSATHLTSTLAAYIGSTVLAPSPLAGARLLWPPMPAPVGKKRAKAGASEFAISDARDERLNGLAITADGRVVWVRATTDGTVVELDAATCERAFKHLLTTRAARDRAAIVAANNRVDIELVLPCLPSIGRFAFKSLPCVPESVFAAIAAMPASRSSAAQKKSAAKDQTTDDNKSSSSSSSSSSAASSGAESLSAQSAVAPIDENEPVDQPSDEMPSVVSAASLAATPAVPSTSAAAAAANVVATLGAAAPATAPEPAPVAGAKKAPARKRAATSTDSSAPAAKRRGAAKKSTAAASAPEQSSDAAKTLPDWMTGDTPMTRDTFARAVAYVRTRPDLQDAVDKYVERGNSFRLFVGDRTEAVDRHSFALFLGALRYADKYMGDAVDAVLASLDAKPATDDDDDDTFINLGV